MMEHLCDGSSTIPSLVMKQDVTIHVSLLDAVFVWQRPEVDRPVADRRLCVETVCRD